MTNERSTGKWNKINDRNEINDGKENLQWKVMKDRKYKNTNKYCHRNDNNLG